MKLSVTTNMQWTEPTRNLKEGETPKTYEVGETAVIDTDKVFDYKDLIEQGVISVIAEEPRYANKRAKLEEETKEEGGIE